MADPYVKFLRRNQTAAETLLWHQLRRKRVDNRRFRRQYRLGPYIVVRTIEVELSKALS